MYLSIIFAAFWVVASTITALLPMRHQYKPAITLLILAPALILWLGYDFGWWLSALALIGFVSMFRNPLRYIYKKLACVPVELPQ